MNKKIRIYILIAIAAAALAIYFVPRAGDPPPEDQAATADGEITEPITESSITESTDVVTPEANLSTENKEIETVAAIMLDPENTIVMQLSTGGPVIIETFPDKAPNHVARFKELSRQGFYDGVVFHRVIEGFMAQTGDPTGTGSGGSGQNINAEFNDILHVRGIVSTARAQHPDSADSQFFIMFAESPSLDNEYTAWGKVVEGMEYIDAIARGPREANGVVPEGERDQIISMRVMADIDDDAFGDASGEAAEEGESDE